MALPDMINGVNAWGATNIGYVWPLIWTLVKIVCVLLPLMGLVAYATLWERKLIGWIQIRVGPNRVGPMGLLQPIADALKLLFKEIVVPTKASSGLFILGPIMTIMPALAAWVVVPFGPGMALADVNAGLLLLDGDHLDRGVRHHHRRLGVELEILVHGRDARLGPDDFLRNSDRLRAGGDPDGVGQPEFLRHRRWPEHRLGRLAWHLDVVVERVAAAAAVRGLPDLRSGGVQPFSPFDVVEGESEIVAGHMVEYSGMSYAMFMLAEYANMILIGTLASIMFLGGWHAPFAFAGSGRCAGRFPRLLLAVRQGLCDCLAVHLGSRHLPALSL